MAVPTKFLLTPTNALVYAALIEYGEHAMITRLRKISDDKHIGTIHVGDSDRWRSIQEIIADEFRCWPDDVDSQELDDGQEVITVHDEPVARLEHLFGWRAI